ncbi:hypothetical protein V8B97DRAFT_1028292 [Scleroderma yunnanense]
MPLTGVIEWGLLSLLAMPSLLLLSPHLPLPLPLPRLCFRSSRVSSCHLKMILRFALTRASTAHPFSPNMSAPQSTLGLVYGPGGLDGSSQQSAFQPFLVVLNACHVPVPAQRLKLFASS